jgi:hypothetical protein
VPDRKNGLLFRRHDSPKQANCQNKECSDVKGRDELTSSSATSHDWWKQGTLCLVSDEFSIGVRH